MADLHAWAQQRDTEFVGYIAVGEHRVWESSRSYRDMHTATRAAEETMKRGLADLFSRFEVTLG